MKSLYSILSNVADELHKEAPDEKKDIDFYGRFIKKSQRYLFNILDAVGVNINKLREKNNFDKRIPHKICDDLEDIIIEHAKNNNFPTKNQILEAIDSPSPLTAEIILVAKLYLKDNFTEEVCVDVSEQIDGKFKAIIELIKKDIEKSNNLINDIRKNMVSLKFRAVQSMEDIYKTIYEMYYFIKNYSPDETPHLTENELIIIDFIRLNRILDNIYKDIQFKHTITSLSLKK